MSLRLIIGRSGSGKSEFCLKSIKKNIEGEGTNRLILVVPDQFSFGADKNLLDFVGEKSQLRAGVMTFKRMAYRVENEVGKSNLQNLNSAGKCMLINKILEEHREELKFFKNASLQQGFYSTICEIITEFKRYGLTPENLKESIDRINLVELKLKIEDLCVIYNYYQNIIKEKYFDAEDEMEILSKKIKYSNMFDASEIWIDEFSTFNAMQILIIGELLKKAHRVNITLCSGDEDIFEVTKRTEDKLLELCRNNNISYEKPIILNGSKKFNNNPTLAHLERNIYRYPRTSYCDETNSIEIFRASNSFTEIEQVGRTIISLVRDKGLRYRDIAVVTGDMENYGEIAQVIFNQYGIPYFIDMRRDIDSSPFMLMINGVMEIFEKGWTYESMFKYLRTGLTGINREDIDILENYVLKNGIKGTKWYGKEPFDEVEVEKIRLKVITPLINLRENIRDRKNCKDICVAIFEFLEELNVYEELQEMIEGFKTNGSEEKGDEYSKLWNVFVELLEQIATVTQDENMSLTAFIRLLKTGIEQYDIGLIPASLDSVLVGSIQRVKSRKISTLFILGVNDGIFPQSFKDEGILSDRDREELKNMGMEIASDTVTKSFEERFLIYSTITMPKDELYISYPVADMEGKNIRPSVIISSIKKIFPQIKEKSDVIKWGNNLDDMELISSAKPTFNEVIRGNRKGKVWEEAREWFESKEEWKDIVSSALMGTHYTNKVKPIKKEKVKKIYSSSKFLNLSTSRLEKYSSCPFSYYMQYGLKAEEREILKFEPVDIGSFLHEAIDKFSVELESCNKTFKDVDEKWSAEKVDVIVEAMAKERTILKSSNKLIYFKNRLKKSLTSSINFITYQVQSGDFVPRLHEQKFSTPMLKLNNKEEVNLVGRIDRMDLYKNEEYTYFRIIDYKSGTRKFSFEDVYYGLQMQLLIYLEAVLSQKEKFNIQGEAIPGAIFYFHLGDPLVKGFKGMSNDDIKKELLKNFKLDGIILGDVEIVKSMDKNIEGTSLIVPVKIGKKDGIVGGSGAVSMEEIKELRQYIKIIFQNLCNRMFEGEIDIAPYKKKDIIPCTYCSYLPVCNFDSSISENRYRNLSPLNKEEALQLIKDEVKSHE